MQQPSNFSLKKHHLPPMKNLRILAFAFLLSSTIWTSCDWFTCKDALALCDLAINAFTAPLEVTVGSAFDAVTEIANVEDDGKCTTTELAKATTNLLEVFLSDGNGNWTLHDSYENIPQQSIAAGDLITLLQNTTINQAGNFRLDYYSDFVDAVDERAEFNNYSTYGRMDARAALKESNNYATLYIKVLPLPDGTTRIPGKPLVEFNR